MQWKIKQVLMNEIIQRNKIKQIFLEIYIEFIAILIPF